MNRRSKSSGRWLREHHSDRFVREARQQGLRSRAAFKLEELAAGLVRPGQAVVDLGCWPGGWLQVSAGLVGPSGRVVGVDLAEMTPLGLAQVRFVRGDLADAETRASLRRELGRPANVLLSDMAPKLSGIRDRDLARSQDLVRLAFDVAGELLAPGGAVICKLFMGAGFEELLAEIRPSFDKTTIRHAQATRRSSAELYLLGKGYRRASVVSGK